ncbi:MAG TPA: pilus assembly protein PilM [Tepidisphaeraceae bacterium]|nr:pilus assembly protein PilM [Tepidisphaeraceae bacterium]
MFGFLKKIVAPTANPIGVDFGTDCLRMAQVQTIDGEPRIVAAGSADVPSHVRNDPAARAAFFVETARDLLAQGKFKGRQAVLALPAAQMYIQHLRIPRLDDEATRKALPWEARGKIPIDPSHALLRHTIAGEIYQDSEPRNEVILMAAARDTVNSMLASAAKAKLDVIGMNVEPMAIVDCFGHIYRRKTDQTAVVCFVDIGYKSTRAVIACGPRILFARSIPVGGEHFNRAVAQVLSIGQEEAKLLRIKLAQAQPSLDEHRARQEIRAADAPEAEAAPASAEESGGFALLNVSLAKAEKEGKGGVATVPAQAGGAKPQAAKGGNHMPADPGEQIVLVEEACHEPLVRLVEELDRCRRYYEATFPSKPVEKLIFVGGEARQRRLCQNVAREMSLAAQVGDPLVRMGRLSEVGIESGIDRRQPQPGWATAIGLSLGPIAGHATSGATE